MKALLVEDDGTIAEFIIRGLREAGFTVASKRRFAVTFDCAEGSRSTTPASSKSGDVTPAGQLAIVKVNQQP